MRSPASSTSHMWPGLGPEERWGPQGSAQARHCQACVLLPQPVGTHSSQALLSQPLVAAFQPAFPIYRRSQCLSGLLQPTDGAVGQVGPWVTVCPGTDLLGAWEGGAVSPRCSQQGAVLKMTVLSPVAASGEASLWPDPRWELAAESLPRRGAEPPSPRSSPRRWGGACWPWQLEGRCCTSSWDWCSAGRPPPSRRRCLGSG